MSPERKSLVVLWGDVQSKPDWNSSKGLLEGRWDFNNEVTARSSISERKWKFEMGMVIDRIVQIFGHV